MQSSKRADSRDPLGFRFRIRVVDRKPAPVEKLTLPQETLHEKRLKKGPLPVVRAAAVGKVMGTGN